MKINTTAAKAIAGVLCSWIIMGGIVGVFFAADWLFKNWGPNGLMMLAFVAISGIGALVGLSQKDEEL